MKTCWTCFVLMTGCAFGSAELVKELIPRQAAWEEVVRRDGYVRYDIVHRSTLAVPRSPDKRYTLESLELRHALPDLRPWSETEGAHGAIDVSYLPESGAIEHLKEFDAHEVKWFLQSGLEAGAEFEFETRFSVISCDRVFQAGEAETSWDSYKGVTMVLPTQERLDQIPEELVRVGEAGRAKSAPHEAVLGFSEWIRGEMAYDVRWDHEDLEGILDKKAGHCFHFVEVFKALCRVAGIPMREVYGMRLTEEDGLEEELIGIRQDFANRFKWAEVFFPEYGWIEVEPTLQQDPFSIPANFVQANRRIFNDSLQVIGSSSGGERGLMPLWYYDRTQWKRVYGDANTVTYAVERHRSGQGPGKEKIEAAAAAGPAALIEEREWTDVEGRKMVAALERFADEAKRVLVFRRSDGKIFEFPVERLAEADRAFLLNALDGN